MDAMQNKCDLMQIVSHAIFTQYTFLSMSELSSVAVPWAKAFESKLNLLSNSRVEQMHHFSSISRGKKVIDFYLACSLLTY